MGKSSVLAEFRRLGAATIDSDIIVAELLRDRAVIAKIRALLGPGVVDASGGLVKRKVAARIFADADLRRGLEGLLHPLVMKRVDAFVSRRENKGRVIVVEVPLLFEGGYDARFDRTITVFTSRRTALERLVATGVPEKDAVARMKAQLPISRKKRSADYRISNEGSREQLRRRVQRVFRDLTGR